MAEGGGWDIELPDDVVGWVCHVFRECNEQTSALMTRIPNVHEGSLDHAFIYQFSRFSAPHRVPSDWLVTIENHFLGDRRHFGGWEIADIRLLVFFRKAGKVLRSKVGLLQSERLYSNEQSYDEDTVEDYMVGFRRLFRADEEPERVFGNQLFTFKCREGYHSDEGLDARFQQLFGGRTQAIAAALSITIDAP